MLAVLLVVMFFYSVVGMTIERNRFAVRNANYKVFAPTKEHYDAEYADARHKRDSIRHKSYCFTTITGAKHPCKNCTPSNENEYRKQTQRMESAKNHSTQFPKPRVNYAVVPAWPLVFVHDWMRSGEAKVYNPTRVDQLEREFDMQIKELT